MYAEIEDKNKTKFYKAGFPLPSLQIPDFPN